jgi:hypothetical protein
VELVKEIEPTVNVTDGIYAHPERGRRPVSPAALSRGASLFAAEQPS